MLGRGGLQWVVVVLEMYWRWAVVRIAARLLLAPVLSSGRVEASWPRTTHILRPCWLGSTMTSSEAMWWLLPGGVVAARCREHGWAWQEGGGWRMVDVVDWLVWSVVWETMPGESLSLATVGASSNGVRGRRCLLEGAAVVMLSSPLPSLAPWETLDPCSCGSDDGGGLRRVPLGGIILEQGSAGVTRVWLMVVFCTGPAAVPLCRPCCYASSRPSHGCRFVAVSFVLLVLSRFFFAQ